MKYVGTYNDPKDIVTKDKLETVASRVSTNEDNIAMAESDIEGLQTSVGTLQTNVGNIQTALTSKQDTIVGAASTITENNLTASRALVSNSSGKVAVSDITSTELGYLDGVTSNVQTQLSGKQPTISVSGILKGTGNGNIEAAVAGIDYLLESDLYICTVTGNVLVGFTCDKNPTEIKAASDAGKIVVANTSGTVYLLVTAQSTLAIFARDADTILYKLAVKDDKTATLTTTSLQKKALITDLEANKDNNTSYPSAKAVYDAIPHPDAKTDNQTQAVGVDTDGKLWTNASSVTSVNGKTGEVQITAEDIGALSKPDVINANKWFKTDTNKNVILSDLPNASTGARGITYLVNNYTRTDTDKAVTPKAVNDVYKLIPTKTSQLDNDSGFITSAPVTSVNGQIGAITLTKSNVGLSNVDNVSINARLNRMTNVAADDTNYTNYMARGEALFSYEHTPSVNGTIAWQYE